MLLFLISYPHCCYTVKAKKNICVYGHPTGPIFMYPSFFPPISEITEFSGICNPWLSSIYIFYRQQSWLFRDCAVFSMRGNSPSYVHGTNVFITHKSDPMTVLRFLLNVLSTIHKMTYKKNPWPTDPHLFQHCKHTHIFFGLTWMCL